MIMKDGLVFFGEYASIVRQLIHSGMFESMWQIPCIAPIIGIVEGQKGNRKISNDDRAKVLPDEINSHYDEIIFAYRIVMLLNEDKPVEERKENAFIYYDKFNDEDREFNSRVNRNYRTFMQYLYGGIDILYEKLIAGNLDVNNEVTNKEEFIKSSMKYLTELMEENNNKELNADLFE